MTDTPSCPACDSTRTKMTAREAWHTDWVCFDCDFTFRVGLHGITKPPKKRQPYTTLAAERDALLAYYHAAEAYENDPDDSANWDQLEQARAHVAHLFD